MGGRGSAGGNSRGAAGGGKASGTMSVNKSSEQIREEVDQLNQFPAGTKIQVTIDGSQVTLIAHDEARMGRNGRYIRRRRYSELTDEKYRGSGIPKLVKNSRDPYSVAEKPWKKL